MYPSPGRSSKSLRNTSHRDAAGHAALVAEQFGRQARAYVESADHAVGTDLARLAVLASSRPPGHVLDLGCGGGHVSYALAPFAREVMAVDLSPAMLSAVATEATTRGHHTIRTRQAQAGALPFGDATFDMVVTRYSAHHWLDLAAGLAGLRRVLKPGGVAVVIDTVSPGLPTHDAFLHAVETLRDPSHRRDYTVAEWARAMHVAGFATAAPSLDRLRLALAAWTARMAIPDLECRAIRALRRQMPADVAARFGLRPTGPLPSTR